MVTAKRVPDYLIDTNVLVYALDGSRPHERARAVAWLDYLIATGAGALSTQALTEVARVCLGRLTPRWHPDDALEHVQSLARAFYVFPVTPAIVAEALRGVSRHKLSFFDAQMWAVARLNQIPALLTQDMASGAEMDGVLMVDPFATDVPPAPPG
ncbi:MAG: PIN domain-containing protein [Trueperaceae bacterium]|nr:PIN domain-containing protein [Trueperaceae bacterium]MCC6310284.1 PIN domain-containing protein [Trueperaceae bacterium]MCO5173284.1 PIN domain-containing protein [Trueperaceae bacterium]MCW5818733.1 PIN domain-containing protein [Trueperaceae bacterium]